MSDVCSILGVLAWGFVFAFYSITYGLWEVCVNFCNVEAEKKERVFQILVLMQLQVAGWVGMSMTACWETAKWWVLQSIIDLC